MPGFTTRQGFPIPIRYPRSGPSRPKSGFVPIGPLTPGTPLAWWDADAMVGFANNDAVGAAGKEWLDRQGNTNHHGRNSTASLQPTYKTNKQNGRAGVLFTWTTGFGTQHYLDCTNGSDANSIIPAGDYTVLTVARPSADSPTPGGGIIGNAYAGNQCNLIMDVSLTNLQAYDQVHGNQSNSFVSQLEICNLITFIRSGGNMSYFFNRSISLTNGAPSAVNGGHFSFLGAAAAPNANARWGGYIHELVIYNFAFTTAQLNSQYDSYYKPKWGLS